tara:strand:- start:3256 stop:4116 length:861 start_codon:yes stop_codon:yes gene_type:complete
MWSIEQTSRNVHTVNIDGRGKNWEQWVLLSSDRHHDNAHTNHKLELTHLKQVVERNALILDAGDMHCAMQGKWDKRADMSALRPEYAQGMYLDSLVEHAANFYAPYAKHFIAIGRGNHEQSILKRHETDLTERTCQAMTSISGHNVVAGGYGGWVRFKVNVTKTTQLKLHLKYFHGSGGGGPVTRGVIGTNRMAVYLPDADVVVTGHTHDSWIVPIQRERIDRAGNVYLDTQTHVKTGTYKDEYHDGYGGWHIERGGPPKPLGAIWLRIWKSTTGPELKWELTRAE